MALVWLLQHAHEWEDGHEDIKLIGILPTEEEARRAIDVVRGQPGFRDMPDGFCVS
jgi:hypothetical protein